MLKLIFMYSFEGVCLYIILDSSMVEHTAVNRGVVGSSPTRGVTKEVAYFKQTSFYIVLKIPICYGSIKARSCT